MKKPTFRHEDKLEYRSRRASWDLPIAMGSLTIVALILACSFVFMKLTGTSVNEFEHTDGKTTVTWNEAKAKSYSDGFKYGLEVGRQREQARNVRLSK